MILLCTLKNMETGPDLLKGSKEEQRKCMQIISKLIMWDPMRANVCAPSFPHPFTDPFLQCVENMQVIPILLMI